MKPSDLNGKQKELRAIYPNMGYRTSRKLSNLVLFCLIDDGSPLFVIFIIHILDIVQITKSLKQIICLAFFILLVCLFWRKDFVPLWPQQVTPDGLVSDWCPAENWITKSYWSPSLADQVWPANKWSIMPMEIQCPMPKLTNHISTSTSHFECPVDIAELLLYVHLYNIHRYIVGRTKLNKIIYWVM